MSNPHHKELRERLEDLRILLFLRNRAKDLTVKPVNRKKPIAKEQEYIDFIDCVRPKIESLIDEQKSKVIDLCSNYMSWNLDRLLKDPIYVSIDSVVPPYEDDDLNLDFGDFPLDE